MAATAAAAGAGLATVVSMPSWMTWIRFDKASGNVCACQIVGEINTSDTADACSVGRLRSDT